MKDLDEFSRREFEGDKQGEMFCMIKYSVIVPAYNAEHTITACLNALTRQSVGKDDYEVVVVDDGSTDGTGDIIKKFPVRYIRQENKGPAAARNRGAREALGGIILFTDADCIPDSSWIAEMVKPFKNYNVAAVKGAYKTSQKTLVARFAQAEFEERFELLKKAKYIDMVDTYSAAFRKEIFWKAGGFDESFPVANNEDTDLSYKLSERGFKMVFHPDAIVSHLNHPDSVKRYARLKFWRGYWRMVVYKRFPEKAIKDSYTPQSLKFQIIFLFGSIFFAFLSIFMNRLIYLSAGLFAFFIATTVPFSFVSSKKHLVIGALSPFFLAVRAVAIGSGILYFFLTQSLGKKQG